MSRWGPTSNDLPPKKSVPIHPVALTVAVLLCVFTGCIAVAVLSSALAPHSPHSSAVVDADAASSVASAEPTSDPRAQQPLTREEYRQILIEAGLDPHLADTPTERKAAASARATRNGRMKQAGHLFDSKESVKRAAVATGRAGAAGYAHEASLHGTPIGAGEAVIILDRGFEYAHVLAPGLGTAGVEGWTMNALIDER